MSAAAVIAIRRKRLIRRFREAGATDPEHAVTLSAVGERDSWIFEQMVRHGAFVRTEEGRFFLNEAAAAEFLRQRKKRALVLTGVVLLVFLVLWILGLFA
jgi:hypothetical protein